MNGDDPIDPVQRLDTAVAWFARYRSGRMTTDERLALQRWIDQSGPNQQAWRQVIETWNALDVLDGDPTIAELREDAGRRGHFATRLAAALCAMLVLLVAGSWLTLVSPFWNRGNDPNQDRAAAPPVRFSTPVAVISKVALADGSLVTLDADSAIEARIDDHVRRIRLLRGRALFNVAKDRRRTFVVQSGSGEVTALGTTFAVDLRSSSLSVQLVEGVVRVVDLAMSGAAGQGVRSVILQPGQRLVADDRSWRVTHFDSANQLAWTHNQLVFEDTPLHMVIDEVNRYSHRKIAIENAVVGDRRLSAVLNTGDTATLVAAVETLELARAHTRNDGSILLRPR